MTVHESHSEEDTQKIAAALAVRALPGDVFLLSGNLGAGKSVFARAFIQSLCGQATDVPSPTFTLVQTYDAAKATLWHFDLYRLKDPEEIFELGWDDALHAGISLIEWPERLGPYRPARAIDIRIETSGTESRNITIHDT